MTFRDNNGCAIEYSAIRIDLAGQPVESVLVALDFVSMERSVHRNHVRANIAAINGKFVEEEYGIAQVLLRKA